MYNYVMVMGIIEEIKEVENGHSILVLNCTRQYRDETGNYAKDSIPVHVQEPLRSSLFDNLTSKTNIIIKGRLEVKNGTLTIVAERIIFIEQSKPE